MPGPKKMMRKRVEITLEFEANLDGSFDEYSLADRVLEDVRNRLCNPEREDCGALKVRRGKVCEL